MAARTLARAETPEPPPPPSSPPPPELDQAEAPELGLEAKLDRQLAQAARSAEDVLEAAAEHGLAGRFSRARRRQYHALRRKWRALILHPQRIYAALRELAKRDGGAELVGRYQLLCETEECVDADGVVTRRPRRHPWHPTDLCALRRFVPLAFGLDVAKPYHWGPRALRRRGLGLLGDSLGGNGKFALSMRGVGQEFLGAMLASGDGIPLDRSTVREVFEDLASVGLATAHQPPPGAKLAPFERHGKWAFNQYWFALAGMARKPNMRGPLDAIADWTDRVVRWFVELAHGPQPAS